VTRIQVTDFGWRYATRNAPACENISFTVDSGERVLLLGASGVGKSTLLKAIAGVLGTDEGDISGSVSIDGTPSDQLRGVCGLLLQDPHNQIILERVGDDVAFGMENLGVLPEEIWPRVTQALTSVGLDMPLDHSTSALSGGQQQRLALAGILAMNAGVIALDEPTSQLDPEGVAEVRRALENVREHSDVPIIMVEHRVDAWWDFATRVIVLGPHGVLWDGSPSDLPHDTAELLSEQGIWLPESIIQRDFFNAKVKQKGNLLLSADSLRSTYRSDLTSCPPVSLKAYEGQIIALVGANGSGKTVTALTLAGLLEPQEGMVSATDELKGKLSSDHPFRWRSRDLLSRIGYVFQSPEHQFVSSSVRDELMLGMRASGSSRELAEAKARELVARLGLEDLLDAHPFTLSGGQQRRLSVATVLATAPKVLILDEPTFGQDATTWLQLVDLLRELSAQDHSVVVITHDQELVSVAADVVIEVGGVHAQH
jgi:energy-coupling factor transport system ATP-binding protein